ncbi:MAG: methionyl-tRNA formyltransferase [Actinobacteria bacterium]|nr:methionyl-tRNA formyltransferase [Actinomycetota bacterium]
MRTAFLGTSDFAAAVLRDLAAADRAPALVVTPPDSRRGRGRKPGSPPAAGAARDLDIELLQAGDVNDADARAAIGAARPELGLVCAFGQVVAEPLLSELEMLNVHPSLLPRWRGAAPIERAVMAGDERTGVTIMRLVAELDAGPVALREETAIGSDDYHDVLSARLAEIGARLLVRALELRQAGGLELSPQDESLATYAAKIDPTERRLDPSEDAAALAWRVRALNPHIGTYLELTDGERLGVRRARAVADAPPPGEIKQREDALVLGTPDAGLELQQVQAAGGRPMAVAEFLRGHPAPVRAV